MKFIVIDKTISISSLSMEDPSAKSSSAHFQKIMKFQKYFNVLHDYRNITSVLHLDAKAWHNKLQIRKQNFILLQQYLPEALNQGEFEFCRPKFTHLPNDPFRIGTPISMS